MYIFIHTNLLYNPEKNQSPRAANMKLVAGFFLVMALFGVYGLVGMEKQQGFMTGPNAATKPLIKAEDDPQGFKRAKTMGWLFVSLCGVASIYFYPKK